MAEFLGLLFEFVLQVLVDLVVCLVQVRWWWAVLLILLVVAGLLRGLT